MHIASCIFDILSCSRHLYSTISLEYGTFSVHTLLPAFLGVRMGCWQTCYYWVVLFTIVPTVCFTHFV